jgi:hypothetical protein
LLSDNKTLQGLNNPMLAVVAITRLKTVAEPRVEEKMYPTKNDAK